MKNLIGTTLLAILSFTTISCEKESIDVYESTELNPQETQLVYLAYGETQKEVFENYEAGKVFGFFIPKGKTFEDTEQLFSKYDGTVYTLPYLYSVDGNYARTWNGKKFEKEGINKND